MSTSIGPDRPAGDHGFVAGLEVPMDGLFFALWQCPGCKAGRPEDFWLDPPASGLGRLLAAVAIIGIAASLLDHAAAVEGTADSVATASYGSSQHGR
jgi:hypothetical protein